MKRWLIFATLLMPGLVAAQDSYYQKIHYRDDDPFLFCTKGMKIPDPCWIPIKPYTGQYVLTVFCDPPNTETGRSWTYDDHRALAELESRCPVAKESGEWEPKAGTAEMTPKMH